MFFKFFNQFISESQIEHEIPKPDKLMSKVNKQLDAERNKCPRCGKYFINCICTERDYYSTVNAYRIPAGEKHKKDKK